MDALLGLEGAGARADAWMVDGGAGASRDACVLVNADVGMDAVVVEGASWRCAIFRDFDRGDEDGPGDGRMAAIDADDMVDKVEIALTSPWQQ